MPSAISNSELLFVPEQLYHRRRHIHARFGGQEPKLAEIVQEVENRLIEGVQPPMARWNEARVLFRTGFPSMIA